MAQKSTIDELNIELIESRKQAQELASAKNATRHALSLLCGIDERILVLQAPSLEKQEQILRRARLTHSFDNRPEMRALLSQEANIKAQKALEDSKALPSIEAFLQGGYANPNLNIIKGEFAPYYIAGVRGIMMPAAYLKAMRFCFHQK